MRLLIWLLLLGGLAQAQISFPTTNLSSRLNLSGSGPEYSYRRGTVALESLGTQLYKVRYQGPVSDYLAAGEVLAAALGNPQLSQAFVGYMRQNQAALQGKGRQPINVGDGYVFLLEVGNQLGFWLGPQEVSDFGEDRNVLGQQGVLIREFSDFECPYCRQLAQEVLPSLKTRYLNTGQARFSYRHLPLTEIHPQALPAAIASECAAEQGRFFDYHDALFAKGLDLNSRAKELGLNQEAFSACVQNPNIRSRVQAERDLAIKLGLRGTPTVFVGPFRLPNPFDLAAYERYLKMAQSK